MNYFFSDTSRYNYIILMIDYIKSFIVSRDWKMNYYLPRSYNPWINKDNDMII